LSNPKKTISLNNYSELKQEDIAKILFAFKTKNRVEIIKFLAQKPATQAKGALRARDIAKNIAKPKGISETQTIEHCNILKNIGIISKIRSDNLDPGGRNEELIKYYLEIERLKEVIAIVASAIAGFDEHAAKRIKKLIDRIYKEGPINFVYGLYNIASNLQDQSIDAAREIADNYAETQKNIIYWWSSIVQYNMQYYYPWFSPENMANIYAEASKFLPNYLASATAIARNNILAYIDMSKIYSQLALDNTNELSQMAVNASKVFEPTSRTSIGTEEIVTPIDVEPEYSLSTLQKLKDELTEILQIALSRS
jgi:hypothetical protein